MAATIEAPMPERKVPQDLQTRTGIAYRVRVPTAFLRRASMVDPNALQYLSQVMHLTYDLSVQWRRMDVERHRAQELETPRYADPKRLLRHGFKVYSQSDEDGIIQEIFNRIGRTSRAFIEFGVETGVECNTVKLLVEGWSGL